MNNLTTSQIISINKNICDEYSNVFGIRENNLLQSIIPSSEQIIFGSEAYPTTNDKISFIVTSIIKNHCFIDGNKRTGAMTYIILCEMNSLVPISDFKLENVIMIIEKNEYNIEFSKKMLF